MFGRNTHTTTHVRPEKAAGNGSGRVVSLLRSFGHPGRWTDRETWQRQRRVTDREITVRRHLDARCLRDARGGTLRVGDASLSEAVVRPQSALAAD